MVVRVGNRSLVGRYGQRSPNQGQRVATPLPARPTVLRFLLLQLIEQCVSARA